MKLYFLDVSITDPETIYALVASLVVIGILLAVAKFIQNFAKGIYKLVKSVTDLIVKPISKLYEIAYNRCKSFIQTYLIKPCVDPKFQAFGGKNMLIFIIVIGVLSVAFIVIKLLNPGPNEDFLGDFILGMPPFNIIIFLVDGIDDILNISELLLLVCVNTIATTFLRNQDELGKPVRFLYCSVFLIFSGCLSTLLLPIFSSDAVANFFDFKHLQNTFFAEGSSSFLMLAGIIVSIPLLYAYLAAASTAIKDFIGLFSFSVRPLAFLTGFVFFMVNVLKDSPARTPLLAFTVALVAFWAEYNKSFEEELFPKLWSLPSLGRRRRRF